MKKGLVLEGGAMRGMFTCGVLDVFMENDIEFDGAAGVSAGAVFGCNYKSHQIGRGLRYNKKYCSDKRYGSFESLIKTGNLYDEEFCYNELPRKLDIFDADAFAQNPMEFYVVCTDVETGKAVYHKCTDGGDEDILWMRASASIPIVSRVVKVGDRKLLDGGVGDSIPLRFLEHKGYDRNVVILTQPADYVKEPNRLMPAADLLLKDYPRMLRAMANRHIRYNETVEYVREQEKSRKIFVIRPPKALEIGSMTKNPDELERVYQIGRVEALKKLQDVKEFLGLL
jgi:predicted patatin/cPLA2 family phospholipase